jgi:hypothetical protein
MEGGGMKRGLSIVAVAITILFVLLEGSIRWVDDKPWTSYLDNRWTIKLVARFYNIHPFATKEDNIMRTIKIAHFLALSKIEEKSLDLMLLDFNDAQSLIDRFIRKRIASLEADAIAELTLERLALLNRMNAVLLQGNRSSLLNIEPIRRAAEGFLSNVADDETKRALEKEIHLYDINWQRSRLNRENIKVDLISAIEAYHYGLAACAMHDESGAELIELGLRNIPKNHLIEITLRNIDHPLIAAAGVIPNSKCAVAVSNISKQLRR